MTNAVLKPSPEARTLIARLEGHRMREAQSTFYSMARVHKREAEATRDALYTYIAQIEAKAAVNNTPDDNT